MIYCELSNQLSYPFSLPSLPFKQDYFIPYFSKENFEYHYQKHHQAYINNLNNLLKDDLELKDSNLEDLIIKSKQSNSLIFNNAAQVWNHTFFWFSIKKNTKLSSNVLDLLIRDFGSYEKFVLKFKELAISHFGSGWIWLVFDRGKLNIINTVNAETPILNNIYPLITLDLWEHSYYIDYRNNRLDYINNFINKMINWEFIERRLKLIM